MIHFRLQPMKPRVCWRWRRALVAGAAIAAVILALYAFRIQVLVGLGRLLVAADAPSHADVLVVMRGDEAYFERARTVADLFHAGYADRIYVSSALIDLAGTDLQQSGIRLPSAQENIASVLLQKNVPCDRILLDSSPPGGGTLGEARRLAALLTSRNLSSALVVTGWWHSRRTKWIMDSVLGKSGKTATIVIADSPIGPHNWWTFRYTAITVLEEALKIAEHGTVGELDFLDNPPANVANRVDIRSPASCRPGP